MSTGHLLIEGHGNKEVKTGIEGVTPDHHLADPDLSKDWIGMAMAKSPAQSLTAPKSASDSMTATTMATLLMMRRLRDRLPVAEGHQGVLEIRLPGYNSISSL